MKKIFSTVVMSIMALMSVTAVANAATNNKEESKVAFLHCTQGTPYDVCYQNMENAYGKDKIEMAVDNHQIKTLSVKNSYFQEFLFDEIKFSFDKNQKLVGVQLSKDFGAKDLKKATAFRDNLVNFLSQKYPCKKKRVPDFQNIADYGLGYADHKVSFDYPLFIFISEYSSTTQTDGQKPVVSKGYELTFTYWVNDFDKLYADAAAAEDY